MARVGDRVRTVIDDSLRASDDLETAEPSAVLSDAEAEALAALLLPLDTPDNGSLPVGDEPAPPMPQPESSGTPAAPLGPSVDVGNEPARPGPVPTVNGAEPLRPVANGGLFGAIRDSDQERAVPDRGRSLFASQPSSEQSTVESAKTPVGLPAEPCPDGSDAPTPVVPLAMSASESRTVRFEPAGEVEDTDLRRVVWIGAAALVCLLAVSGLFWVVFAGDDDRVVAEQTDEAPGDDADPEPTPTSPSSEPVTTALPSSTSASAASSVTETETAVEGVTAIAPTPTTSRAAAPQRPVATRRRPATTASSSTTAAPSSAPVEVPSIPDLDPDDAIWASDPITQDPSTTAPPTTAATAPPTTAATAPPTTAATAPPTTAATAPPSSSGAATVGTGTGDVTSDTTGD